MGGKRQEGKEGGKVGEQHGEQEKRQEKELKKGKEGERKERNINKLEAYLSPLMYIKNLPDCGYK